MTNPYGQLLESYSWLEFLILLAAGIVTGIINTIAGSGTIFSVGAMIFLGIPIEIANTTNRLGVLFQNCSGLIAIRKHGRMSEVKLPLIAFFASFFGALLGAYFAATISRSFIERIALVAILLMIFHTFLKMRRLKRITVLYKDLSIGVQILLFFIVGFYGGLIQIGVGIIFLLMIETIYQRNWAESNYLKLIIILGYTIPTTLYFGFSGMILWIAGLILAFGQVIGAYLAGWTISINQQVVKAIPIVILLMLIATGLKLILG